MDNAKRASMREGPLAQLFRKTEEEEGTPKEEERKAEDAKTGSSGNGDRGVNGGSTSTPVSRPSGGSLDKDG